MKRVIYILLALIAIAVCLRVVEKYISIHRTNERGVAIIDRGRDEVERPAR